VDVKQAFLKRGRLYRRRPAHQRCPRPPRRRRGNSNGPLRKCSADISTPTGSGGLSCSSPSGSGESEHPNGVQHVSPGEPWGNGRTAWTINPTGSRGLSCGSPLGRRKSGHPTGCNMFSPGESLGNGRRRDNKTPPVPGGLVMWLPFGERKSGHPNGVQHVQPRENPWDRKGE